MHHPKVLLFLLAQALLSTARPHNCPRPTKTCTDSLCVDYVDACGNGYGGCFLAPSCGGTWPTFTAPSCTITPTPTTTCTDHSPSPTISTQCDMTICADYINSCGKMYGGCFLAPQCGGTWPTFTPPPCTTGYTSHKPSCTNTICADYINSCGKPYGGCFLAPECGGTWPTFTPPPCTTTTEMSSPDTTYVAEVTPTEDVE